MLVGVATGLAVAAIEEVANDGLLDAILRRPIAVVAVAPTIGLVLTVLVTKRFAGGDGATTDAYIRSYHEKGGGLGVRRLLPKVIAWVCSLGTGAALGFEGPAIVVGGTIGSLAERRLTRRFRADDAKILMVAGRCGGCGGGLQGSADRDRVRPRSALPTGPRPTCTRSCVARLEVVLCHIRGVEGHCTRLAERR